MDVDYELQFNIVRIAQGLPPLRCSPPHGWPDVDYSNAELPQELIDALAAQGVANPRQAIIDVLNQAWTREEREGFEKEMQEPEKPLEQLLEYLDAARDDAIQGLPVALNGGTDEQALLFGDSEQEESTTTDPAQSSNLFFDTNATDSVQSDLFFGIEQDDTTTTDSAQSSDPFFGTEQDNTSSDQPESSVDPFSWLEDGVLSPETTLVAPSAPPGTVVVPISSGPGLPPWYAHVQTLIPEPEASNVDQVPASAPTENSTHFVDFSSVKGHSFHSLMVASGAYQSNVQPQTPTPPIMFNAPPAQIHWSQHEGSSEAMASSASYAPHPLPPPPTYYFPPQSTVVINANGKRLLEDDVGNTIQCQWPTGNARCGQNLTSADGLVKHINAVHGGMENSRTDGKMDCLWPYCKQEGKGLKASSWVNHLKTHYHNQTRSQKRVKSS